MGIIGYGYAGRALHAPLIAAAPGLELVATSTSRPDRAAQARNAGLRVHPSAEALIADPDVDLAVITTPHDSHAPLALAALAAGKHVVTDKLMCLDVSEADAMIAAAARHNRLLSVFHNRRWDGDFLTLRQLLSDGVVGAPLVLRAFVRSAWRPSPGAWRAWRKSGGGIFSDWGAHLMDQALLLNATRVVAVQGDRICAFGDCDVETWAMATITFADGVRHIIETSHYQHQGEKGWDLFGAGGRLVQQGFEPYEAALVRGEVNDALPQPEASRPLLYRHGQPVQRLPLQPGCWSAYYRNIAAHLLTNAELAVPAAGVRRMMALREAILEAFERHETVAVSL